MYGILVLALISLFSWDSFAKTVHYDLTVKPVEMNLSGRKVVDFALAVNGQIPAPTLEFTEGDDAEILVKNEVPGQEVSIHWHGILLPPEEDGVPYVNTPPIFTGSSRTFRFKIRQSGTYWYHSHTMLQEQKGVYGPIVIHPAKETIKADREVVAMLSDWTDENPDQVMANLRKDGDFYLYKKGTVRSIFGAARAGGLKTYLQNEWERMGGMDVSDVGYDAFLINGKRDSQLVVAHPGERVRVRLINAGSSSYFYVSLAGLPMEVVAVDGVDVTPVHANEILMGMAETYDVVFTVPEHKNFELRATAQDVTGFASSWIGMGEKVSAPDKAKPDLYAPMMMHPGHAQHAAAPEDHTSHAAQAADHSAHGTHGNHARLGEHPIQPAALESFETLTVDSIKSLAPTKFSSGSKVHDVKLVLGGSMRRYVWHINGKTIDQDRTLSIDTGDIVRFEIQNATMMHHPMHLHGHFFRVLNANGESSPLKHTVDVPPHSSRTIEFMANEPGEWMFHCHNLFHMKTGMARVVKYSSFTPRAEIADHQKHDPHLHEHIYGKGRLEVATNHAQLDATLMRTWDELELRAESSNPSENEGDLLYRRWLGDFSYLTGGGTLYHEKSYGILGVGGVLPLLVDVQALVNHEGHFRIDLDKKFQWTSDWFTNVDLTWRPAWKGDRETDFEVTLMYGPDWHWSAGLMATPTKIGVGLQAMF